MKNIKIRINRQDSKVYPDGDVIGINSENLQGNIIFDFNEFVDGIGWLEVEFPNIHHYEYTCNGDETGEYKFFDKVFTMPNIVGGDRILYITPDHLYLVHEEVTTEIELLDGTSDNELQFIPTKKCVYKTKKVDDTYVLPIKSSLLTQTGMINMQLRITQEENLEGIPVFKSNIFYVKVKEAINAIKEVPDFGYAAWLDIANAKILEMDEALAEVDRLDIDATKVGKVATVSITNKEGTTKSVDINDGEDAKINGVNTITIEAGTNIGLEQEGSTLTIENTYDDSDKGATIEATINTTTYVMTVNLKNSAGTVISTATVDLPLESVVVSGRYDSATKTIILTLQNGNTIDIPVGDLVAGLQTEITSDNKLSSDLVDDTNHTNKFVTTTEKTTWNNKSDFSGDYNDLSNQPDLTLKLDKEDAITMFSNAVVEEVSPSKEIEINSVYGYFGKKLDQDELVYDLELLGESTQETTTGKQLFNKNIVTSGKYINSNGEEASYYAYSLSDYMEVEANTIYTYQGITAYSEYGAYYDENKDLISAFQESAVAVNQHITTPNNAKYVRFTLINTNDTIDKFQFEKGSSATSYEPYTGGNPAPSPDYPMEIESITSPVTITSTSGTETNTVTIPLLHPMRSIGTTRDRIYWNNGKWYDEQNIVKAVLDGSDDEGWTLDTDRFSTNYTIFADRKLFDTSLQGLKCNYFTVGSTGDNFIRWRGADEAALSIKYSDYDNVTDFKAWLSSHNVEFDYVLETPIITEITDTATIEALESIRTYTGLTEITSDIDIVGSYVRDINEVIPTKISELTNDERIC